MRLSADPYVPRGRSVKIRLHPRNTRASNAGHSHMSWPAPAMASPAGIITDNPAAGQENQAPPRHAKSARIPPIIAQKYWVNGRWNCGARKTSGNTAPGSECCMAHWSVRNVNQAPVMHKITPAARLSMRCSPRLLRFTLGLDQITVFCEPRGLFPGPASFARRARTGHALPVQPPIAGLSICAARAFSQELG